MLVAVDDLSYRGGNTNTTGGLIVAKNQIFSAAGGDRDYADNLLILLSDGEPTRMVEELFPYAAKLRNQHGIRIIGIGVTDAVNEDTFKQIVSEPFDGSYFPVTNFDQLQYIIGDLIEEACRTTAPRTTTPSPVSKYILNTVSHARVCFDC